MIGLQHAMTYRLRVRGPMTPTRGSPRGERQYWEMSEGTLTGDRINARIAMPGGDWYSPGVDGSDARTFACNSLPTMMR
jgi:Protein of unknown function (DUF3237)